MASVIASIAAVCVMTGGIGYQAAVSGAQTDSTESSVKDQNTCLLYTSPSPRDRG